MSEAEHVTIVGRFADTGETTVTVIPYSAAGGDPHLVALRHTAALSQSGEFEVVAVLRGRPPVLVTQQSLRLFADRLLAG